MGDRPSVRIAAKGIAFVAMGTLCIGVAQAEQWQIRPNASVSGEYSNNPRLLLDDVQEAYGWLGNLQLGFTRATERTSLGLQSSLHYAHYTDEDDYDRNDRSMALELRHQAERTQWTADVQFVRNNTLASEFETTGLVRTNKIRESLTASGSLTHALSESFDIGSQLAASKSHYRDAEFTELIDYDYTRASLFADWQASARTRWSLSASASELRPEFFRPQTEDYSVMLRWTFVPQDLWTIRASAGPSWSRSAVDRQSGALYALDVGRRTERGGWMIAGSRERTPTGLGVLAVTDRLTLSTYRALNEQWSFTLQGVVGRNRDLFRDSARPLDLKFARVETRLGWMWSPELRFDLMLASMEQNNSHTPQAKNFSIALGFSWNGESLYL